MVLMMLICLHAVAQDTTHFSHADTLRGSNGPARAWWDVQFYDLHTRVNPQDSSITGWNGITYRVLQPAREMQIDLQQPLVVDSMVQDRRKLTYRRDGNAFFVTLPTQQRSGASRTVTVWYHGKPRVGRRLPWDGGFTFPTDSLGNRWIATANEGLGASVWWPTKDYLADEPDSQRIAITVPDPMIDVSNGRLRSTTKNRDGTTTYEWFVTSPINTYNAEINAGQYTHFGDTLDGEAGKLTLDFWPLAYHADTARRQFQQVIPMLRCFEHWFGPYPWYADGYKLIETPHLGMEHQSGVAYGNFPQRLPGPRPVGHGPRPAMGLHHRPRERARVVGEQHLGPGSRRHVGAREFRQLRRGDLHRVPPREERWSGLYDRRAPRSPERPARRARVWRERARLRRHVSQRREHAAHDPRDHR